MIEFGRSIRWYNEYETEVTFSKKYGFSFLQIWYKQGALLLDRVPEPRERYIKENGFPVIIHGLFDINEFETHLPRLIEILLYLEHKEVIIHPICESESITEQSICKLCDKVKYAASELEKNEIQLLLENNSKLDPIHYKAREVAQMFSENPKLEFLLDVAHMDDYKHLEDLIKIKKPNMLHIADKHFDIIHEHLPLGLGELDYKLIFERFLTDFDGKVIFEIVDEDEAIIKSKKYIDSLHLIKETKHFMQGDQDDKTSL